MKCADKADTALTAKIEQTRAKWLTALAKPSEDDEP